MSALTQAPWHEFRLGHVEVSVHPDVFNKDVDPKTDQDIQRAILISLGAAVGKHGLRWHNTKRARLRRPTQYERLFLLELVLADREAEGATPLISERQDPEKLPRVHDFVLELDFNYRRVAPQSKQRRATRPTYQTAFFGLLWPEGDGQNMIYELPTEVVEPEET